MKPINFSTRRYFTKIGARPPARPVDDNPAGARTFLSAAASARLDAVPTKPARPERVPAHTKDPAAILLILGVLMLSSLLALFLQLLPAPKPPGAAGRTALRDGDLGSRACWYIRSGQWRGDIRTLGNALAYLVRPESPAPASAPPSHPQAQAALVSLTPTQTWTLRSGSNSPVHIPEWPTHS